MKNLQLYAIWLICFALSLGVGAAQTQPSSETDNPVFLEIEVPAQPKGGYPSFYKYIAQNLKYPEEARKAGIEGRVFLQFIIRKDGSITDVSLLKGIGHGCDEEAIKVVQNAEKWIPGTQRGEPVNVRMSIPIVFKLSGKKKKK